MKLWMLAGLVALLGWTSSTLAAPGAKKNTPTKNTGPELKIPSTVPRLDDFAKVVGEAKAKHKPVVVVISEEGSTKKTILQDTQYAMQRAKSIGLLVYVDTKESKKLPKNLSGAAGEIRGRNPGMIIVDSETEEAVATVRHSPERADWDNDIRDARRKIRGAEGEAKPAEPAKENKKAK